MQSYASIYASIQIHTPGMNWNTEHRSSNLFLHKCWEKLSFGTLLTNRPAYWIMFDIFTLSTLLCEAGHGLNQTTAALRSCRKPCARRKRWLWTLKCVRGTDALWGRSPGDPWAPPLPLKMPSPASSSMLTSGKNDEQQTLATERTSSDASASEGQRCFWGLQENGQRARARLW